MDLFEYFTTDNISGKKCNQKWLKVNNPDLYIEITNWCDSYDSLRNIEFKRKVYHYINKLVEIPTCKTCKSSVNYSRLKDGYRTYCSDKCVKSSEEYYKKWLISVSKTLSSGDFIKKREKTWKDKYGDDFYKIIQEKRRKNIIDKHGCENVFQLESTKNKRKESLLEKYGSEKYNNPDKTRETRIKNGTQINDESVDKFIEYKKVVINRTITIYRNNKHLINSNNLKRSKRTYHIDHLFSIKQGFLKNLPVEIISHPCNLHMIHYKENLIKQDSCWITLNELLEKIISYEKDLIFTHEHLKNKYSKVKEISENLLLLVKIL
jgi:hypothetical protein